MPQVVEFRSKRYKEAAKKAVPTPVAVDQAIGLLKEFKGTKFDQSVELIFSLGIDPKQADQMIRGSVSLPHGIGKSKRVIAFCQENFVEAAKAFGKILAENGIRLVYGGGSIGFEGIGVVAGGEEEAAVGAEGQRRPFVAADPLGGNLDHHLLGGHVQGQPAGRAAGEHGIVGNATAERRAGSAVEGNTHGTYAGPRSDSVRERQHASACNLVG